MFERRQAQNSFISAMMIVELIFHATVRSIRSSHNNAFIALALNPHSPSKSLISLS